MPDTQAIASGFNFVAILLRENFLLLQISRDTVVEVSLHVNGVDLKHVISARIGVEASKLKLVAAGHVVEDDKPLSAQSIKASLMLWKKCTLY